MDLKEHGVIPETNKIQSTAAQFPSKEHERRKQVISCAGDELDENQVDPEENETKEIEVAPSPTKGK